MTCVKRRKTIRHWPYPISIFERVAILRPRRLEKTCNRAVGSECYRMHVICGLQSRHQWGTITSSVGHNHVISGASATTPRNVLLLMSGQTATHAYLGVRIPANGDPEPTDGDPSRAYGDPEPTDGDPSHAYGDPEPTDGDPSHAYGDANHAYGDPTASIRRIHFRRATLSLGCRFRSHRRHRRRGVFRRADAGRFSDPGRHSLYEKI